MKSQIQENICKLYLRLNGFFTTSLIIHSPNSFIENGNRTEIDLLGVRFPFHKQPDRSFDFDDFLDIIPNTIEIVIGEVKGQKESLQFNKAIRNDYSDEIIQKLFNWIGIFSQDILETVISDYRQLIQTKPSYCFNYRIEKIYELNNHNIRIRPIIFGIDRFNYRKNQIWHINGKQVIDFLWRCLKEKIDNRDCSLNYDYSLWGNEFSPIIRFIKESMEKPKNFKLLYARGI